MMQQNRFGLSQNCSGLPTLSICKEINNQALTPFLLFTDKLVVSLNQFLSILYLSECELGKNLFQKVCLAS